MARSLAERASAIDWGAVETGLDADGAAVVASLLTRSECKRLAALYTKDDLFRSTVVMSRHGYGRGEYRYFAYPLPEPVASLRAALYPRLVPVANRWSVALGKGGDYPKAHARYVERCHAAGQTRPTPLLLQYGAGDF
ncbi:MAG TPA: 2OG-Fe(II) oxygenase, partial [Polyangiaceae bacterium]|nr:2OG-Fe(II) oxygenase [Polyangiaceae bacterium]